MSSAHPLEASTATRLDASQGAQALPSVPFNMAQKRVYPSLYPLPGASHPPLVSPRNATLPACPLSASGACSTGVVYYAAHYPGYNPISSQAGFIPPIRNPAFLTRNTDLRQTCYPLHDTSLGNLISITAPLASEDTCHHEQPAPSTFQSPLATQPAPALDQWQVQHLQHNRPAAQEDLAPEEPPREPGDAQRGHYRADEEPHADPGAPDVGLRSDQSNNQADPPEEHAAIHICSNNPNTACSGNDVFCLDILSAYVAEYPDELSAEQVAQLVIAAIAPTEPNVGTSAGPSSQVDTTEPTPSQQGRIGPRTASPGSNSTAPAPASAHVSPTGCFLSFPSGSETASSSIGSTSRSAAKRQRSEDQPEDRAKRQRQRGCTDANNPDSHCESSINKITDANEKRRKKKKSSEDVEYICRICVILRRPCGPLSRKDALKRHILSLHEMFEILFDHEVFDPLKPRRKGQAEDLDPLIAFCIGVQSDKRRHGTAISPDQDIATIYPRIAAALNRS